MRIPLLLAIALALTALPTGLAGPTQTTTIRWTDEVAVFSAGDVCTGEPGTVTTVSSGVLHETAFTEGKHAGEFKFTITDQGDFTFVPDDPTKPTVEGHFTLWAGWNQNTRNAAGTFTIAVTGVTSEGERIHGSLVEHFSSSATGVVRAFAYSSC